MKIKIFVVSALSFSVAVTLVLSSAPAPSPLPIGSPTVGQSGVRPVIGSRPRLIITPPPGASVVTATPASGMPEAEEIAALQAEIEQKHMIDRLNHGLVSEEERASFFAVIERLTLLRSRGHRGRALIDYAAESTKLCEKT